jgi:hypothetical protein
MLVFCVFLWFKKHQKAMLPRLTIRRRSMGAGALAHTAISLGGIT